MKRLLLIVVLVSLMMSVYAQSDSTQAYRSDQYDTTYEDEGFSATNRNPIYTFGNPFCDHFVELKFYGIKDIGVGVAYTYLPEVWGWHLNGSLGLCAKWMLTGADYRLSKPWNKNDWHAYGSLGFRYGDNDKLPQLSNDNDRCLRPAIEVGVRWASGDGLGKFCLTSGTLGLLTDFVNTYVTVGFSSSVALLASVFLLLGIAN